MVHKLRGTFAFVIWVDSKRGLFLARVPFGIKFHYHHDDGKTSCCASQVKELLAGNVIKAEAEPAGHVGYFYGIVCRNCFPFAVIFLLYPQTHAIGG
jgi:asparagine synthase (glutamine-hydrolysing)